MTTFRDTWYPNALRAMTSLRGAGVEGSDGARMPITRALDTLAILAQLSRPLVNAISVFQQSQADEEGQQVMKSKYLTDGVHTKANRAQMVVDGAISSGFASIEDYVAGYGVTGQEYRRYLAPGDATAFYATGDVTYEPWVPDGLSVEDSILASIRQAVRRWQDAVNASAEAMTVYGANLSREMSAELASEFWLAVRRLCVDLDTINAHPPTSTAEKVKASLNEALDKTATVVGEGAAHLAEAVGRTAGNIGKGFFDTAGVTALAVAGIAVLIMLR